MGFDRCTGLAIAVLALFLATPSWAQDNLDSGKTGEQIFASDCAICHKSPQGLNKSGGLFGLSGFLGVHYTASQKVADTVAKYLESLPNAPEPRRGANKRTAKGEEKLKLDGKKPGEKKPDEAKAGEPKPQAKPDKDKQEKAD